MRHNAHTTHTHKHKLKNRSATNITPTKLTSQATPDTNPRGGGQQPKLSPHPTSTQNITTTPLSHTTPLPINTPDNHLLAMWQHAFSTLSPEDFAAFTRTQTLLETPTYPDPSRHSVLLHTHITHFAYGEYKSVHDIHTILAGIYRILNIHISPPHPIST
jgi:hypothetical protein